MFFKKQKEKNNEKDINVQAESKINATYWQYLDFIEDRIHQLKIDRALKFIPDDIYEQKRLEIQEQLQFIKDSYNTELENIYDM